MDRTIDDFSVASDNWDKLSEVRGLKAHLENIRLWYQADSDPDLVVIESVNTCILDLDRLYQHLIDLQIKLITNL